MRSVRKTLQIVAGSILVAVALYGILAVPGLISDSASTVPVHPMQRAAR